MSSPMMTRMLGFDCWADAAVAARQPAEARRPKAHRRILCIVLPLKLGDGRSRPVRLGSVSFGPYLPGPALRPKCSVLKRAPLARRPLPFIHALPRQLVAGMSGVSLLDRLDNSTEIVALRRLQRRELLVGQEVLQPELLADGQHV